MWRFLFVCCRPLAFFTPNFFLDILRILDIIHRFFCLFVFSLSFVVARNGVPEHNARDVFTHTTNEPPSPPPILPPFFSL